MSLTVNLLDSSPSEPRRTKSHSRIISYEEALNKAGDCNLYQFRVGIIVSLGIFISGVQIMGFPFIFKEPQAQCKSDDGEWYDCSLTAETCRNNEIRYHPDTQNTVAVTYDFFCEREEYRIMAETAYMISTAFGVVLFGSIADKYGKRFALLMTYLISTLATTFHAFAPNWGCFMICLILSGLGRNPFIYFCYQLLMEVSNEKFRARGVLIMGVSFAIGAAFTGPMNSIVNYDWQYFYFIFLAIPCLIGVPLVYLWSNESPISFFPKRDYESARMELEKIAKVNGRTLPDFTFDEEESSPTLKKANSNEKSQEYTYLDLFRYKSLRKAVLGGAYLCFVTYFVFYGQMLALDTISTDPVIVSLITSIVEAASCAASTQFLTKLPRKTTFIWSFTFTAVAFLMFGLVTSDIESSFFTMLGYLELSLGRFWVAMLMCTTFVYNNELFPTVIRSRGSGFVGFFGRIGSVIPSTAIYLCKQIGLNPTLLFGAAALSATWVAYYMKETKGERLKHNIEEEETKVGDIELEMILAGRSVNV